MGRHPAPSLLALLLPCVLAGQEVLRPVTRQEFWASASVKGRLPKTFEGLLGEEGYKRVRLGGELGYRSADNFFAGRQTYADLGMRYKLNDLLSLGTEYRYAARTGLTDRQRIGLQSYLGHSWKRFGFGHRFIWQRNFLGEGRTRTLLRNRFTVEYNIRKWKLDPEFSVEFFTRTDHPRGWNWIGTRYKLGTSWSPWKGHTFGPAIVYDRDARVDWPVDRLIWSVDYGINLRRL